jgi:hypothetical protein
VLAEQMPVFHGRLGVSDGNYAVKVTDWIQHRKRKPLQDFVREAQRITAQQNPGGAG